MTTSKLSAFAGTLFLAFVPVLWSQTVSAEVYTLHAFFVALLIRLLWWWDEGKEFAKLALFVFVTGLSFGNHMQTVMLAPAVIFILVSGHYKTLLNFKNLCLLSVLFFLALSLYLYLPIRTEAGAAIHWGDPNTLDRFLAHVTASAHREGYVLTKGTLEYVSRAKQTVLLVFNQFGMTLMLALWGWYKIQHRRWKIFFAAVILFDCVYTVFLNIISFEITAFALPTSIVLALLMGNGIAHILEWAGHSPFHGKTTYGAVRLACCMMPVIPLVSNFDLCNQSRNYMAYEHVLNIFRTVNDRSILFLDGDNNIFPVTYGRIVERIREDVTLYDRLNLLFGMPSPDDPNDDVHRRPEHSGPSAEERIVKNAKNDVYFAVFNPEDISLPDPFTMYPFGILYRPLRSETPCPECLAKYAWTHYETESVHEDFRKDFMNRHLAAHFHFALGRYLFATGQPALGLKVVKGASQIAYDDTMIHSDIALFLIDKGFLDEARGELEKALVHAEDLSGIYTNWGYYYWKRVDYDKAIVSFRRAVELRPGSFEYHNNLGLSLHQAGRVEEALAVFQRSLKINPDQPKVERFFKEYGLNHTVAE
jgi:tetratricopeptide (TPR) repeat protein